jgi:hypothetical protein
MDVRYDGQQDLRVVYTYVVEPLAGSLNSEGGKSA